MRNVCNRPGGSHGFSLIEMMVTMAVMAIMCVAAVPFSFTWADNANLSQAQASLQHGFSVTKALALENPTGQVLSNAAAILCFNSGQLTVYTGAACSGTSVWQATLPSGVTVLFGSPTPNATPACIALTNTGAPTSGSGATCTTVFTYSMSKGSAYVLQRTLY